MPETQSLLGGRAAWVQTPKGRKVVRYAADLAPEVVNEDSASVFEALTPSGELFGKPLMFVIDGTKLDQKVRDDTKKYSNEISKNTAPVAVVCAKTVLRFALKAMLVLAPHSGPLKIVETEAAGLDWFDTAEAAG